MTLGRIHKLGVFCYYIIEKLNLNQKISFLSCYFKVCGSGCTFLTFKNLSHYFITENDSRNLTVQVLTCVILCYIIHKEQS